jgi:hypothetical protein
MIADAFGDRRNVRLFSQRDGEPTGTREGRGIQFEPARCASAR